jgi:hypothetical protein
MNKEEKRKKGNELFTRMAQVKQYPIDHRPSSVDETSDGSETLPKWTSEAEKS